jgi:hypothetical protein
MVTDECRILYTKKKPFAQHSKGFLHIGEYVNIMDSFVDSYTYIVEPFLKV